MLRRQKTLLGLVADSGGAVTRTVLMKLAFLARHETSLKTDHAFYHFVPYKYGPFSFALYRELATLERYGYLAVDGDHIAIPPGSKSITQEKIRELPACDLLETKEIAKRYASLPQTQLLKYVYAEYPWYASKSELKHLKSIKTRRRRGLPAVYTIGYEGRSIDAFFGELLRTGMALILDVRANPISRKYGFAKSSLSRIASKLGIDYQHIPEFGIPSDLRKSLGDYASYQRLFARYQRTVLRERNQEISSVAALMEQHPSVLLCMEKDVRCCHRGRLADAVASANGLHIKNL